jgi:hypothetical protein
MRRLLLLFALGFSLCTSKLYADDADSAAVVAAAEDPADEKTSWKNKLPFDISGSVDAYIQTNFAGKETNTIANEAFSSKANSFELGMINLMMSKEIGKVGFMADIGFGPRAESANNTIYSNTILAIKQLYITYAPAPWVKFTLGNFSTFFGYELIEPQNNTHYSTSLAFQNGPFYHTGFKANFTKGKFNFLTGFFNDTDTKSDDDRNKYVGAQVGLTCTNGGLYLNFVGGNEPDTLMERKYKSALGLTGTLSMGKNKKGVLVTDVAWYRSRMKVSKDDEDASNAQYIIAYLYAKYLVNEKLNFGLRAGYLNDADYLAPYTAGDATHYGDVTLTANYMVGPLRLAPEFRLDFADEKVFVDRKGGASSLQYRLLLAAIFAF